MERREICGYALVGVAGALLSASVWVFCGAGSGLLTGAAVALAAGLAVLMYTWEGEGSGR